MAERRLTLLLDDEQDKDILKAFDNAGKGVTKLGRRRLNVAYLIEEAGVFDQLEFLMKQGVHNKTSAFEALEKAIQITKMIQGDDQAIRSSNVNQAEGVKNTDSSATQSKGAGKDNNQNVERKPSDSVVPAFLLGDGK